ncbi:MAG: hypothetical protein ACPGSL_09450 [Vicingaceae bacterium]
MEDVVLAIIIFTVGIWLVSFLYNIFYFYNSNDSELDTLFINLSKTFDEARDKFSILEKIKQREYKSAKKKLAFYEENARRTRRKYTYYSDKIEPFFLSMIIGNEGSQFKSCWKLLDKPIKFHYIILYVFLIIVALFILLLLIFSAGFFAIPLFLLVAVLFWRFSNFVINFNFVLFYLLLDGILIVLKQDRGKLYKNIGLLGVINSKCLGSGSRANGYGMAAGGVIAYTSFGNSSDFGGFGGGDFGGGGAGGDW